VSADDPWAILDRAEDQAWLRRTGPALVREVLQQTLLFPATRLVARPRVTGADDLGAVPQPAVIAANHASDLDTPLVLAALPRVWRARTVVAAAEDRFHRSTPVAVATSLWVDVFPFDRSGDRRGLARAATFLDAGRNVLLYPQGTRQAGLEGFRAGVGRLCVAVGVPLVPVHVGGTALLMPKGRGILQRGTTTVRFGRPLAPEPGEDGEAFSGRASAVIAALARAGRSSPSRSR
jgi:1-acyl-sn-glycerol-3-phosphate acyltransferase